MNKKSILYTGAIFALLLIGGGYAALTISKSRTFQFFGGIVRRVDSNEKVVALTFDDAPGPGTKEVLRDLDRLHAKATFFAVGQGIQEHRSEMRSIVLAGHELGNHTYSHKRMVLKTPQFIRAEIECTDKLIKDAGYSGKIPFRPPNGKKLFLLPWYLKQHNRQTILWDVEPNSFPEINADMRKIVDYTVSHTKPGSIILLHPFGAANKKTRQAIPKIITALEEQNYRFVTVTELQRFRNKR